MQTPTELIESLAAVYAPVQRDLALVESIFDEELVGDLPFVNDLADTVRSYRGKMLRPAQLLLAGRACGELSAAHHTVAAVVEMVHMATLVHDDVLDEADERRRQPTINNIAGNEAAVLLGDYLISHAFHLCSELPSTWVSRRIGATTNTVCEGELLQNNWRGRLDLTEEDYLEIIVRKTAALTATACELGAALAGADAATVAALREYGRCAGVAFQITDDVLDILGDPASVGKTLRRDAGSGKLTLPLIHCLATGNAETVAAVRRAIAGAVVPCRGGQQDRDAGGWGKPGGNGDGGAYSHLAGLAGDPDSGSHFGGLGESEFVRLLTHTGSLEYALTVARQYVMDAIKQLDAVPPSDARTSLSTMAEFIIARRF